jgi:hypothetical protein
LSSTRPDWQDIDFKLELLLDHLFPGPLLQRYAAGLPQWQINGCSQHL